jgi:hypothetical protein
MLLICPSLDTLQRLVSSVYAFGDFQRAHLKHKLRSQDEDDADSDEPESDVLSVSLHRVTASSKTLNVGGKGTAPIGSQPLHQSKLDLVVSSIASEQTAQYGHELWPCIGDSQ